MKSISKRYIKIFERHYAKRAEQRCAHIIEFAHVFLEGLDFDVKGYYVDESKVHKAIESYFLDVIKYKEYHFNAADGTTPGSLKWEKEVHLDKKINDSKVAAFTAKWLLKSSPIFVLQHDGPPSKDDLLVHVNELFVLNCVLYTLLGRGYDQVDRDEYDRLFYDFKYRSFDDRAYFSRFELIEKNVKLKRELTRLRDALGESEDQHGHKEKAK